jgi:hypothetical protein
MGLLLAQLIMIHCHRQSDPPQSRDRPGLLTQAHLCRIAGRNIGVDRAHLARAGGKPTPSYDVSSSPAYFEPAALAWLANWALNIYWWMCHRWIAWMTAVICWRTAFWGLPAGAHSSAGTTTAGHHCRIDIRTCFHCRWPLPARRLAPFVADAAQQAVVVSLL